MCCLSDTKRLITGLFPHSLQDPELSGARLQHSEGEDESDSFSKPEVEQSINQRLRAGVCQGGVIIRQALYSFQPSRTLVLCKGFKSSAVYGLWG